MVGFIEFWGFNSSRKAWDECKGFQEFPEKFEFEWVLNFAWSFGEFQSSRGCSGVNAIQWIEKKIFECWRDCFGGYWRERCGVKSIYQFIHDLIHPVIHASSNHPTMHPFIHTSIHASIYLYINPCIYLSIHESIHAFSIYTFTHEYQ